MKKAMDLTLALPTKPTPSNLFEGMHALERTNPAYIELAAQVAVDGFIKTKDEEWLSCVHSLYEIKQVSAMVEKVTMENCEPLFAAADTRKVLAWLCVLCRPRLEQDAGLRERVISMLLHKKISYDELVFCVKTMGFDASILPALPAFTPLPASCNTLAALADVAIPMGAAQAEGVRVSIIDRLCTVLENDCTWQDFYNYIPEILKKAKYRPTTSLHPTLELRLCRQLVVLATDVLGVSDGQMAYVELLTGLRRDYCLRLYPSTGAAAGVFDEKKQFSSSFKKLILRTLPLLPLCLAVAISVMLFFMLLPALPADSVMQTAVPGALAGVSALMILLQILVLRRNSTANYILPPAVTVLVLALMQLLM